MVLAWALDGGKLHAAKVKLGGAVVHLVVEGLCDLGWDWQVWDVTHPARAQYGLADSLSEAKLHAERALAQVVRELVG